MSWNIVEKVLQAHLRKGAYVPGNGICHQVHLERFGATIEFTCALSEKQTAVVLAGGLLNHITSA